VRPMAKVLKILPMVLVAGGAWASEPMALAPNAFPATEIAWVTLGRDLFYDPILSGNQNIACATCHHPSLASGDGVSLGLGEGATGLGLARAPMAAQMPRARIPRNAPALWNVGASKYVTFFHDGRVTLDSEAPHGIRMPTGRALPAPVSSPLAAQVILPLLSPEEMAGAPGENSIADRVAAEDITSDTGAWALITARVAEIPSYHDRFERLTGTSPQITDLAEALAAFITFEFRAVNSPWDKFLAGETDALSVDAQRGALLFFGDAKCSTCHSGALQTNHGFHAIGIPQLGPGKAKAAGLPSYADIGRQAITGNEEDRYRFRTPSLRMVSLTGPYGHSGAYGSLEAVIRHHSDPILSLMTYDRQEALLPKVNLGDDWGAMEDQDELINIAAAIELPAQPLDTKKISELVAFLEALTDTRAAKGRLGVPSQVPSGLAIDR
jgi:cytochrome c peroxidase